MSAALPSLPRIQERRTTAARFTRAWGAALRGLGLISVLLLWSVLLWNFASPWLLRRVLTIELIGAPTPTAWALDYVRRWDAQRAHVPLTPGATRGAATRHIAQALPVYDLRTVELDWEGSPGERIDIRGTTLTDALLGMPIRRCSLRPLASSHVQVTEPSSGTYACQLPPGQGTLTLHGLQQHSFSVHTIGYAATSAILLAGTGLVARIRRRGRRDRLPTAADDPDRELRWPEVVWALTITVIALAVRLYYVDAAPQQLIVWDSAGWINSARALLADGAAPPDWISWWIAHKGPGYTYFLSAFFAWFGTDPWAVRGVQAALGALTCLLVYAAARPCTSRGVALLAAGVVALYPPLVMTSGWLTSETIGICLLWLGIAWLIRGTKRASGIALMLASACVLLAALTRPTILQCLPFLALAIAVGARQIRLARRGLLLLAFCLPMALGLWSWNRFAQTSDPTVGVKGMKRLVAGFLQATEPDTSGWARDPADATGYPGGPQELKLPASGWAHRLAGAGSLLFYHVWFASHGWWQPYFLSLPALHALHRVLILLGLAGVGLALLDWRRLAPLLALLGGLVLAALKFVEVRHHLPYLPALFIVGGVLITRGVGWMQGRAWSPRVVAGWFGIAGLAALLYTALQLLSPGDYLPYFSSAAIGVASDIVLGALVTLLAGGVYHVARAQLSRAQSLTVVCPPALIFVALLASTRYIGAAPGWRAWQINLTQSPVALRQEIRLAEPLSAEEIESATWLVDIQTRQDFRRSRLRVRINDVEVPTPAQRWAPLLSTEGTAKGRWYAVLATDTGLPLSDWRQWWKLDVDPVEVAARQTLRLELAREDPVLHLPPACQSPWGAGALDWLGPRDDVVHVGGVFRSAHDHVFYGPSVSARVTADTSEYRWLVLDDWRFWNDQPLASAATMSYLVGQDGVARAIHGELSVRLLVQFKDGHSAVY